MLTHLRTIRARLTRSWKAVALVAVGALAGGTVLRRCLGSRFKRDDSCLRTEHLRAGGSAPDPHRPKCDPDRPECRPGLHLHPAGARYQSNRTSGHPRVRPGLRVRRGSPGRRGSRGLRGSKGSRGSCCRSNPPDRASHAQAGRPRQSGQCPRGDQLYADLGDPRRPT